jgi:hypothetical protein
MLNNVQSPAVPKSEQREIVVVVAALALVALVAYFRASQPSGSDILGRSPVMPTFHSKVMPG